MFGIGKKSGGVVAVADIGSGSAAFVVFDVPRNGPAKALAAARAILPIEERSQQAAITAIMGELERLAQKVLAEAVAKQGKRVQHPASLMCILRAPWTNSQSIRESKQFEKDEPITEKVIGELARATLAKADAIDQAHRMDASVMRVELNGYPTKKPEGKKARSVGVTSLISGCEPDVKSAVERTLEKILPHTPRTLRSGARALLTVLHEYSKLQEYVVVDIGGEGTSMTLVREGAPAEQCLVPEGIYTILRKISSAGLPEETLSLMRMVAREECGDKACSVIIEALAKVEPELVKVFGEGMAKCAMARKLPTELFLVTHPDMAPWLAKFFARIDFTQFTKTAQPFLVHPLSPDDMGAWATAAKGVSLDCGMAVGGALVNIEAKS